MNAMRNPTKLMEFLVCRTEFWNYELWIM